MTRWTRLLPAAALLIASTAPGLTGTSQALKGEPGPGYIKTKNVTHVATIPVDADIAGGRMVGKDFFVRTAKGITIYDTTNPALPTPKGFVAVPATPNQEREDIDTNGKILVTGQSIGGTLFVVNVVNRTTPTIVGTLQGAAAHTNTCVLDCTFVYGSSGQIVDLKNPAAPVLLSNRWTTAAKVSSSHDLTEVSPGFLAVASNPVTYLDARDPASPKLLTKGKLPDSRYMHGVNWPRGGADRFLLGGSETSLGCQAESGPEVGSFVVFDTLPFTAPKPGVSKDLAMTGQYQLTKGNIQDLEGRAPAAQHCGHWFETHPSFKDGGLVAMAWYTSGVRFLEVTPTGTVVEKGFWQPLPGQSSAVYWASDDLVYVTDYTARAIDVLRYDRTAPAAPSDDSGWVPAGSAAELAIAREVDAQQSMLPVGNAWLCRPAV